MEIDDEKQVLFDDFGYSCIGWMNSRHIRREERQRDAIVSFLEETNYKMCHWGMRRSYFNGMMILHQC